MVIMPLKKLFVSSKIFVFRDGEQCLGPGLIDIYSPQTWAKLKTETVS